MWSHRQSRSSRAATTLSLTQTHLGDSGMTRAPIAKMEPMTTCIANGTRHEASESRKEQK